MNKNIENNNTEKYCTNDYNVMTERVGDMVATTLYRDGLIVLYEETVKEKIDVSGYGEFEITKVMKRIHFDENGKLL